MGFAPATPNSPKSNHPLGWTGAVAVLAVALWSYYPTLRGLVRVWTTDPNYSQGYVIPILAMGLLGYRFWTRAGGSVARVPCFAWGAGVLCAAVALRGAGAYFFVTPLDHASVLVTLVGLCLLFGGFPWLRTAWPALLLLVFAFPIPDALGGQALPGRLQAFATRASTFALETLGLTAAHEGNVILLRSTELGVVEACSGLRCSWCSVR